MKKNNEPKKKCGKCNKLKGVGCKCGRPSEYKEEYINKVDEYLETRQDSTVAVVRQKGISSKIYDTKIKVKLPTIEGFALYIGVNKTSLYEWEKIHQEFSNALGKIRTEQQERLVNSGLSGEYNPTIAKLILSSNHGMRERTDLTTNNESISENDKSKAKSAIRSFGRRNTGKRK